MFNKKKKAEKKAKKAAEKAAKLVAAKKAKVKKVERPAAPKAPIAKPVDTRTPEEIKKAPAKKVEGKVNAHMLGNAMIEGLQYKAGTDIQVPASVFRAMGTSAVTMNTWKEIQKKSGLTSLNK